MATRTFTYGGVNYLWSTGGNWDTPPINLDSVVIDSAGSLLDRDLIADGVSLAALTINAGKSLQMNAGSKLWMTGNLVNNATQGLIIGGGTPMPLGAAGTPRNVAIYFNANAGITGTGTVYLTGAQRATIRDHAAQAQVAGDSTIVLTTGFADLIQGDLIEIAQSAVGVYGTQHTVLSYVAGTKTVTFTAPLGRAVTTGDMVLLMTRPIHIYSSSTSAVHIKCTGAASTVIGVEFGVGRNPTNRDAYAFTGCSFNGPTYCAVDSSGLFFTDCVGLNDVGTMFGNNRSGIRLLRCHAIGTSLVAVFIQNAIESIAVDCEVWNCAEGMFVGSTVVASGCTCRYCNKGILRIALAVSGGSYARLYNCNSLGNAQDIDSFGSADLYNCVLGSGTEFLSYNSPLYRLPSSLVRSFRHDGGVTAKGWPLGGVMTTQAGVFPAGRTQAYQILLESATYYGFFDWDFTLEPSEVWTADVWLRQNEASLTNEPQWQLIDPANDPLVDATKAVLASYAPTPMSINTWYQGTITYTNATAQPMPVKLRLIGRDATATVYGDFDVQAGAPALTPTPFGRSAAVILSDATARAALGTAARAMEGRVVGLHELVLEVELNVRDLQGGLTPTMRTRAQILSDSRYTRIAATTAESSREPIIGVLKLMLEVLLDVRDQANGSAI